MGLCCIVHFSDRPGCCYWFTLFDHYMGCLIVLPSSHPSSRSKRAAICMIVFCFVLRSFALSLRPDQVAPNSPYLAPIHAGRCLQVFTLLGPTIPALASATVFLLLKDEQAPSLKLAEGRCRRQRPEAVTKH